MLLLITGQENTGILSMNDCLSMRQQKYASPLRVFTKGLG